MKTDACRTQLLRRKFDKPEMFYRTDDGIQVVRYMPEKDGREQER